MKRKKSIQKVHGKRSTMKKYYRQRWHTGCVPTVWDLLFIFQVFQSLKNSVSLQGLIER